MTRRGNFKFLGKYSWYTPGIGGMFALLAWLLLGAAIGGLLVVILTLAAGQDAAMEYGNLLSYPVMFVPPMVWAAYKSSTAAMTQTGVKLDSNHFSPLGGFLCAILAAIVTIAAAFWVEAIGLLLPDMPEALEEMMKSLTTGNLLVNLLCVSILAPLCEEWLCRGMVLRGLLARGQKPWLAIVISALFFAVIHMNPWQAVPAFILGLIFGYVYYKTGSLKLTMLMHCVNNTVAVLITRVPGWEEAESWKDVIPATPYAILLAASVIVTVLAIIAFSHIRLERRSGNMDPVPSLFGSDEI